MFIYNINMEALRKKALAHGATEFGRSNRKGKKYYVVYGGKIINFGDSNMEDFTQHKDEKRRASYRARASGIKNKDGQLTYKLKTSSNYWSYWLLWM